jgi:hypothetical protein
MQPIPGIDKASEQMLNTNADNAIGTLIWIMFAISFVFGCVIYYQNRRLNAKDRLIFSSYKSQGDESGKILTAMEKLTDTMKDYRSDQKDASRELLAGINSLKEHISTLIYALRFTNNHDGK